MKDIFKVIRVIFAIPFMIVGITSGMIASIIYGDDYEKLLMKILEISHSIFHK